MAPTKVCRWSGFDCETNRPSIKEERNAQGCKSGSGACWNTHQALTTTRLIQEQLAMATTNCNRGRSLDERTALAVLRSNRIANGAVSESSDATPLPVTQEEGVSSAIPDGTSDATRHNPGIYRLTEDDYWTIRQVRSTLGMMTSLACEGGNTDGMFGEDLALTLGFLRDTLDRVLEKL